MAERRHKELTAVLDELCAAVAADGGAALYLDDGDGALERVVALGGGGGRPARLLDQLRDEGVDKRSLVLTIPGAVPGVCVVSRLRGGGFTQQDRALARLYVRRLSDGAGSASAPLTRSVWTQRLEAIQLTGRDELVHELAGLLDMSEAAGGATTERELAKLLATRVRRAIEMDGARVSRWEEGAAVLRLLGRDGWADDQELLMLADSPLRRQALRDGSVAVLQVDALDGSAESHELRARGVRTLILVPLTTGGKTIGLVELVALQPRALSESQLNALEAMARLTATGLERVRLFEQLRSAADTDPVTGVHNHRYLQERLRQELARAARSQSPLAVLMMDLDKFKQVNDRHSHADGDRVLHNIGEAISSHVRTNDIVARYGGDEFVVVLPDTNLDEAELVARRVVNAILEQRHDVSDGSHLSVGVSAGLAIYPEDGRTMAQLLGNADAAMYGAKRGGGRAIERSAATYAEAAAATAV